MSTPFFGKQFTFPQPDGTTLAVRGWGNQHHAVFETLDGYTVVQDPSTGYWHYAKASDDGEELVAAPARAGTANPGALGLAPGVRIAREAARAKAMESAGLPPGRSRWEVRRERAKALRRLAPSAGPVALAPPSRKTVGTYVGLCLLVEFPDVPATIRREDVLAFCNQPGYTGFGNHGSVYDYYLENSGGKLRYNTIVAPYCKAKHPRAYYTDESIPQPRRARELIKEALTHLKASGFDVSSLTVDDENYIYAVNVFYTGPTINNWSKGLWPHSYHLLQPFELVPGKNAFDYQITDLGTELTLGTYCHENGHMICDFPDLYDYGDESNGVGVYCLMCAGANVDPKNPTQINAYLKYRAGWADQVTPITNGLAGATTAGKNQFYVHAKGSTEYFIVENRNKSGRDAALTSSGLAIWHIDETGDNSDEQMTPAKHYECTLVQADGKSDLEKRRNDGDAKDLFGPGVNTRFADATLPSAKWWDGTPSKLDIHDITAPGVTVRFRASV